MSSSNDNPPLTSDARKRVVATTSTIANEALTAEKTTEKVATPNTNAIVYQKKRRHVSRSEIPRWQIVLSVVTKLCLLAVGILWLGQMILKLGSGDSSVNYPGLDVDGRIYEFESFVKKNVKLLQIQVEVVDNKLKREVSSLTKELSKQIEEKSSVLEKKINELDLKNEGLSKSIGELRSLGFLTKEEFEDFKSEFAKKMDANINHASLDEIGAFAKAIVVKEIEKHAADGIGRVDYALGTAGAKVLMHSEPYVSGKFSNWFERSKPVHANSKKMLEPSFGEPGQCFALRGSSGFVDVKLRSGIVPEAVTLEHVAKSVAYDRSSAPKDCVVSALFKEPGGVEYTPQLLTKFSYDLEKSNIQTFDIATANPTMVNMIRFEFTSNHGNPSMTCIYRLRVHGYETKTESVEDESMR